MLRLALIAATLCAATAAHAESFEAACADLFELDSQVIANAGRTYSQPRYCGCIAAALPERSAAALRAANRYGSPLQGIFARCLSAAALPQRARP